MYRYTCLFSFILCVATICYFQIIQQGLLGTMFFYQVPSYYPRVWGVTLGSWKFEDFSCHDHEAHLIIATMVFSGFGSIWILLSLYLLNPHNHKDHVDCDYIGFRYMSFAIPKRAPQMWWVFTWAYLKISISNINLVTRF